MTNNGDEWRRGEGRGLIEITPKTRCICVVQNIVQSGAEAVPQFLRYVCCHGTCFRASGVRQDR